MNASITEFGSSGFHIATKYQKHKSIDILLKYGAQIDKADKYEGWTPLIISVLNFSPKTCKILLKRGALRDLRCREGLSAIDYARGLLK